VGGTVVSSGLSAGVFVAHSGASKPAMMACLVDTLWTIENLYDALMRQQAEKGTGADRRAAQDSAMTVDCP
jgi:hypothetical protein